MSVAGVPYVAWHEATPNVLTGSKIRVARLQPDFLSLSESSLVWAVTSDPCGWFSGWRRADSRLPRRSLWLTGKACVARRRPRTAGVA